MYPFYLGIDLHLKRSYMVLMDAKGEVIDRHQSVCTLLDGSTEPELSFT